MTPVTCATTELICATETKEQTLDKHPMLVAETAIVTRCMTVTTSKITDAMLGVICVTEETAWTQESRGTPKPPSLEMITAK